MVNRAPYPDDVVVGIPDAPVSGVKARHVTDPFSTFIVFRGPAGLLRRASST